MSDNDQASLRSGAPATSFEVGTTPVRANILMVDDQPARLLTYESILSGLGVRCVKALSGDEALARLLQEQFAVLLLDVEMPGMDGFELARLIREHPRLERTPIIFVTGVHVSTLDQLKGYEVGAIDYLSVPVVPEILRSKVAVLIELHERRDELRRLNSELSYAREQLHAQHSSAVAARDARFQALLEHPHLMTVVCRAERDASGVITDLSYESSNANAARVLGVPGIQLIGRRFSEVLPYRVEHTVPLCSRVLETGQAARYEARLGDTDMSVSVYPLGPDEVVISAIDITERRRAEAALSQSEGRYRALVDYAPVGVMHASLDGRIEYANHALCELLGYRSDEIREKTWQDLTHPDDLAADNRLAQRVLTHELPHYKTEKRYVRKDGTAVWVELFGSFVFDEAGAPLQGIAVVIDIGERKRADRALRESRESLLLAKRAAQLGTFDWDIPSDTLVWDERTHELWGIDPSGPMKVATFFSQVHPDDHAAAQRAIDRSFDPNGDGLYAALYRVINRVDGITRWVEATGRVYFEGRRPARMVGVVQEVTDRVLAQQRLSESEQRFRELANNIDQFAWTCDELGRASWYNDRWYEYTGTSSEEMSGDGWQRVHHPEHLPRVIAHLHECLRLGESYEDTFPLRGKDGQYRWFLTRAVPIRDQNGRVLRWFGTNTDITEQRALQNALEETDRRKDEFLAMLAHELRNPVAPISNAAEVLARLVGEDKRCRPLVDMVHRQAVHLARLLDDLLDVARVTQGRIELRREVVSLATCIDQALETAQPLIREKAHRVTLTQMPSPLYVNVDKVRLAQCIANVLINAAKYTDDGGEIRIRPSVEGRLALVEVSDTGVGIAPDFLSRVFDLFAQSERALDRSQGGLGIGLAVCKQLIGMHGGTITASSAGLGHGATFTIRLPLVEAPHTVAAPEAAAALALHRILVVDDNADSADSLAMLLQMEGHETRTAYSAGMALELLAPFDPDVIILDIGLPDMDGYQLARQIRAGWKPVRLIALSGYGQVEDKQRSSAAGFDAHLVKPADAAVLRKVISPPGR